MGGHNDLFCGDPAAVCGSGSAGQFPHRCVFIDMQVSGESGHELQRVELGLIPKPYRPCCRKWERQTFCPFSGKAQPVQSGQFLLQLPAVIQRVDIGGLLLKIAVYVPAKFPIPLKGFLVGKKIILRPPDAKGPDQSAVDQAVLTGDLGGGVFRDAAAHSVSLRQHTRHPGTVQQVGAKDPGHTAADDENVGFSVALQLLKSRMRPGFFPQ